MATTDTLAAHDALAISERELASVIKLVYEKSGITLHDGKRALILARLQKRLRAGGFPTFTEYLRHVETDPSGEEMVALLDAIATNHTSFFREVQHFDYLRKAVLPEWQKRGRPSLDVWSAACSSGEEPFTLGMTLLDHLPVTDHGRIRIRASDMSTKALAKARAAVYPMERSAASPRPCCARILRRAWGRKPVRSVSSLRCGGWSPSNSAICSIRLTSACVST